MKLYNSAQSDRNDIITEAFRSKAILVGSPTINRGILLSVTAILEEIKELGFKGKKAAAFGSYGWSGEGIKNIGSRLHEAGFEVINEGVKSLWNPDDQSLKRCFEFGSSVAEQCPFKIETVS